MDDIPYIPIEGLFNEIDIARKEPLRWWSVKTAREYLGVSEPTIRRYIASGKLESCRKIVKGHTRVYLNSRSVIKIKDDRKWRKAQRETKSFRKELRRIAKDSGFEDDEIDAYLSL